MNVFVYDRLFNWLYASEGPVRFMYLDKLGLVTVGIGFMIDPIDKYIREWGNSFKKKDGTPASPDDVRAEFNRVKCMQKQKGAWKNFEPDAELFLPAPAMKPMVLKILRQKENALQTDWRKQFFEKFDFFPSVAQMGVLSTAYGGMYNSTPAQIAFNTACKNQEWSTAAESGRWDGWEPPKIAGHKLMFRNAQVAKDTGDDNPQPAFPGTLTPDSYEIDDTTRPYGQDIWKAGTG